MMFKGTTTIGAKNYAVERKILDAIEKPAQRWIKKNEKAKKLIRKSFIIYQKN